MGALTRFLIVAAPRTGSNLLCTLLGSHPGVLCHHELFNPVGIFYALSLRGSAFTLGTMEERAADPFAFLARVWSTHLGYRCVGFKMTRGQGERVLDALLGDREVHTLVLRRGNRVQTFVSELRAQRTGQWEVYDPAALTSDASRVRVEPRALADHATGNDAFYAGVEARLARAGGAPALRVTYERLFDPEEQQRMISFLNLGLLSKPLTATSVKQNASGLRDVVDNFDDLALALRGTPFEDELMSGEPSHA